jgi:hypothetical protein
MLRHAVVSVAVAAVCVVAGCKKGAPSTGPSNKADGAASKGAADDVLAFLPKDADIVVGVDAAAVRSSALWQQFEPQIAAGMGETLTKAREQCGFDPMKTVERATVGGKMTANEDFEGVIVVRGVGAKTLECMAQAAKGEGTVTLEQGVLSIDKGTGKKSVVTLVGSNTLVAQIGPNVTSASLDATLGSGAPLRSSPAFMALFNRREAGAAAWGMINGNAPFMSDMARAGARPKSLDGTLIVRDRFVGALRMTFATPDEADAVNKQFQQVLPMFQGRFDKVDVRTDGAILRADVVATDEQIKQLLGMFGAF